MTGATLDAHLSSYTADGTPLSIAVGGAIRHLAQAALSMKKTIASGGAALGNYTDSCQNASGDAQHELDVYADRLFHEAMKKADCAFYASEEKDEVEAIHTGGSLAIAVDPLDGSSNVENNISIGTIFSILPALEDGNASFLQPGRAQLAAGFFIYGPQLALALTLGRGTHIFTFSNSLGTFVETHIDIAVPEETKIFAINMSNYRHWDDAVRAYVDDCISGSDGVRARNFNMRWIASMVAEAYRILVQGGIYLYPGDNRKGYAHGRLRLVYEANPIAMLMQHAGSSATDGLNPILDLVPVSLHEHVPLVFGSSDEVETVARYLAAPSAIGARHPLFGQRGLFRA